MQVKSRQLYLVCYDVSNPRILSAVRKLLIGYRISGQKSVYECWMTPAEHKHLLNSLETMLDPYTDRLHIFRLDSRQMHEYLGTGLQVSAEAFYIL